MALQTEASENLLTEEGTTILLESESAVALLLFLMQYAA